ncbi:MAG: hypothetical protein TREMPRED_002706 [Tremellales sp. Tagirdzhanova-0007]|nr:MAG: hypothetical protein TREMPRED_002706 [Tremellales sp. Tagirdzhanova-0007]
MQSIYLKWWVTCRSTLAKLDSLEITKEDSLPGEVSYDYIMLVSIASGCHLSAVSNLTKTTLANKSSEIRDKDLASSVRTALNVSYNALKAFKESLEEGGMSPDDSQVKAAQGAYFQSVAILPDLMTRSRSQKVASLEHQKLELKKQILEMKSTIDGRASAARIATDILSTLRRWRCIERPFSSTAGDIVYEEV